MNANGRRCRQFANGMRHLARLGRPMYPPVKSNRSIAEAIAAESMKARRMQAAKGKKK